MISAFAEFERAIIREGVSAGIEKAKMKWVKNGRLKILVEA
jgi:DNA invertase Pin-like site-specific DNA recombinase